MLLWHCVDDCNDLLPDRSQLFGLRLQMKQLLCNAGYALTITCTLDTDINAGSLRPKLFRHL